MPSTWLETVGVEAAGAIDGANMTFVLSRAYAPGSARYLHNGRLLLGADHPTPELVETDPAGGVIDTVDPPRAGDTAHFLYRDTHTSDIVVGGEPLQGALGGFDALGGTLTGPVPLEGVLREARPLLGEVTESPALAGGMPTPDELWGRLRTCS